MALFLLSEIAEQAAYYGDGFFHNHIFWNIEHTASMVNLYRQRFEHYGHGAADQAIVGLGGQAFMADTEAEAKRVFRPYFDNAPVYGHGPSMEDFTRQTPLTVGTPEMVIERTLSFADHVGDYQRQLFLMDHAGLPLEMALEQVEILGREVVPVLRREFEARRPEGVPSEPPTHASLVAQGEGSPHRLVVNSPVAIAQQDQPRAVGQRGGQLCHQRQEHRRVARLSRGDQRDQRAPLAVDELVDLRRQAASGAADRVIRRLDARIRVIRYSPLWGDSCSSRADAHA